MVHVALVVEPVNSGHCIRQPLPSYYGHLVQTLGGKTAYSVQVHCTGA